MLFGKMQETFDGMRNDNRFMRIVIVGLLVSNVVVGCNALTKDSIVTVVPPTLTEKGWLSSNQASQEMTEAWALYIATMLGNVTPSNAEVIKNAIGPILDSSIYQEVMEVLDKQIQLIRQDRVTLSFEPAKILRDNVNRNKLYVSGVSISEGPSGAKKRTDRTYEFEIIIKNYQPRLTWIGTNSGEARTQDVIEREKAAAAKQAEREQRANSH